MDEPRGASSPLYSRLIEHEYQEWKDSDDLLYPAGSAPTVCRCGATPNTRPPEGDWAWWAAHVDSEGTKGGPVHESHYCENWACCSERGHEGDCDERAAL